MSNKTTVEQLKIHKKINLIITIFVILCLTVSSFFVTTDDVLYVFSYVGSLFNQSESPSFAKTPNPKLNFIKPVKYKIITKENQEKIFDKFNAKYKDTDDFYYFSYYTVMGYFVGSFSYTFSNMSDEQIQERLDEKLVYNKTINEMIIKGKDLMKENNITIEEFKNNITNLSNTINQEIEQIDNSINSIEVDLEQYNLETAI